MSPLPTIFSLDGKLTRIVAILLVGLVLVNYARVIFRKGLRTLPGPFVARFSVLYRLSLVYKGNAPHTYRKLHAKYGPIVRTGPNHVSVSDADMIPVIYGTGSNFKKVLNCLIEKGRGHYIDRP